MTQNFYAIPEMDDKAAIEKDLEAVFQSAIQKKAENQQLRKQGVRSLQELNSVYDSFSDTSTRERYENFENSYLCEERKLNRILKSLENEDITMNLIMEWSTRIKNIRLKL